MGYLVPWVGVVMLVAGVVVILSSRSAEREATVKGGPWFTAPMAVAGAVLAFAGVITTVVMFWPVNAVDLSVIYR